MSWIVRAQWICDDGSSKRFQRACLSKPSQQRFVNELTGDTGVQFVEMDPADQYAVWCRFFVKVDWFEFVEIPTSEGEDTRG